MIFLLTSFRLNGQGPDNCNTVENYSFCISKDLSINCEDGIPNYTLTDEGGHAFLISRSEERFAPTGNECYRVFISYRIINQCIYDGQSDPVIISRDVDCNSTLGDDDICIIVRPNGVTYLDRNNDETDADPVAATINCYGGDNPQGYWVDSNSDAMIISNGYFRYTQILKVYDNINPILPTPPADITVSNAGLIPPPIELEATDCSGNITTFPIDKIVPGADENNYSIIRTWVFDDECENVDSTKQNIVISENLGIELLCPSNETLYVAPGCGIVYDFSVSTDGLIGPNQMVIQALGDPSGTTLFGGTYNYEFQILDSEDRPISNCLWTIEVEESANEAAVFNCKKGISILLFDDLVDQNEDEITFDATSFLDMTNCQDFSLFTLSTTLPSDGILSGSSITITRDQADNFYTIDILGPAGINSCQVSFYLQDKRPIPTLSEWGIVISLMLCLLIGLVSIREKNLRLFSRKN